MARRGLVADLRVGIARARKTQAIVRQAGVRVEQDGSTGPVTWSWPDPSPPESPDEVFAVFFEEPPRSTEPGDFAKLDDELRATKDYLQWKVDEHQRANEQLRSVNEELISRNEELQSLNAEVQAAKEEIQSTTRSSPRSTRRRRRSSARRSGRVTTPRRRSRPYRFRSSCSRRRSRSHPRTGPSRSNTAPQRRRPGERRASCRDSWTIPGSGRRSRAYVTGTRASWGVELDCELPRLGKRCLSLSARFVPMPDTGRLILLAIEDVTARRRGEAERAQLLRETQAAKASAEEANRAKDIFLATLSHELRTPLSTLLLSAELLRTGQLSEDKVRRTSTASRARPRRRRSSSTIFSTSLASSPAS